MIAPLTIHTFLEAAREEGLPIVDVRSPAEFAQGHIPGAINLPLFSDSERKEIGTLYKQQSRSAAIDRGLALVGPRLPAYVQQARQVAPTGRLLVHCWRGGMRSESLAWLWQMAGLQPAVLAGGYKAYRQQVRRDLNWRGPLLILGGKTGSGKTHVLHALAARGELIVDLEALAHHKGSAFGAIGEPPQPSGEQFENNLHQYLQALPAGRRLWVEDESHMIGQIFLPEPFWRRMQAAPALVIEVPRAHRLHTLVQDYASGAYDAPLRDALGRIQKRLGGADYQAALAALAAGDYEATATLALRYYDKAYLHGLSLKKTGLVHHLPVDTGDPDQIATHLIRYANSHLFPA